MTIKYAIDYNGFHDRFYYNTYDEAKAAADLLTNCTGITWTVMQVLLR